MGLDATARRRWFGGLVLLAALAMLIAGQTILKGALRETVFVVYWLVCFALTGVAIVVAFLDVRALQRRVRQEHRDLFHATLKEIETDAKIKAAVRPPNGRQPVPNAKIPPPGRKRD